MRLVSFKPLFSLIIGSGLLGCSTLPMPAAHAPILEENIYFAQGSVEMVNLGFEPAAGTLSSDPACLSILPGSSAQQVKLVPRNSCWSTVTFFRSDGSVGARLSVEVMSSKQEYVLGQIRYLLRDIQGITVKPVGPLIVVEGKLVKQETVITDFDHLLQVQDIYKDHMFNQVTISDSLYQDAAHKMQSMIRGLPGEENVSVFVENGTFLITGTVGSPASISRAETIVQTYLPPMLGSPSVRDSVLVLGAKKFSIRNMLQLRDSSRAPASVR
jgi:hypothetical protein